MTGNEYQHNVYGLPTDYPQSLGAFATILGFNKELGRFSETMLRIVSKPDASITDEERELISAHLGKLLYYLSKSCDHCGLNLDSVMQASVYRLEAERQLQEIASRDMFRPL